MTKYCDGIYEILNYTKNITKEYHLRNLNVLDANGQLLSEKKNVMDGMNIFKEIK